MVSIPKLFAVAFGALPAAAFAAQAAAALNVFATVPEWGALVQELGGDKVGVYVATNAMQDPHHVEAKPSLIAQVAGCGVLVADQLGFEAEGIAVQVSALAAALGGALLLTWTERVWPEVQEAVIGVVFVLGASGSVLLLASNVHGSEHLRDLLVGQILWAEPRRLAWAALVYAAILLAGFGARERLGRAGFYALFALAVTVSVQLVGLYLVFATLIVPPLATRNLARGRLAAAWAIGAAGYAAGLVLSTALDLPSGPVVVWMLTAIALAFHVVARRRGLHWTPSAGTATRRS